MMTENRAHGPMALNMDTLDNALPTKIFGCFFKYAAVISYYHWFFRCLHAFQKLLQHARLAGAFIMAAPLYYLDFSVCIINLDQERLSRIAKGGLHIPTGAGR